MRDARWPLSGGVPACQAPSFHYLGPMLPQILKAMSAFLLVLTSSAWSYDAAHPAPIERENWTYYLDDPGLTDRADRILDSARSRLIRRLGDSLTYRPSIYIVDDMAYFQELVSGRFPDWGAAAAIPQRQMIVIKSPSAFNINKSLDELLAHEYAHLAIDHRVGFHRAPRWFDEGLCMLVSAEWSWSDNLALSKAAVFGQLIPLDSIEFLNRFNESQAHVAYAQSYLTVKFFYDEYTAGQVLTFLDSIGAGADINAALRASTGSNYREFDEEVYLYLTKQYNITSLFMDTMFFWLGLAMIVLIAVFVRYRKRRQYYRKWEQDERLHSTDFDYGNTDLPEKFDDDEDEPWRS